MGILSSVDSGPKLGVFPAEPEAVRNRCCVKANPKGMRRLHSFFAAILSVWVRYGMALKT